MLNNNKFLLFHAHLVKFAQLSALISDETDVHTDNLDLNAFQIRYKTQMFVLII